MRRLLVIAAALTLSSCTDATAPRNLYPDCTDVPDPSCSDEAGPVRKGYIQGGCYFLWWRDEQGIEHETLICP